MGRDNVNSRLHAPEKTLGPHLPPSQGDNLGMEVPESLKRLTDYRVGTWRCTHQIQEDTFNCHLLLAV
jgi:hypothetical protein